MQDLAHQMQEPGEHQTPEKAIELEHQTLVMAIELAHQRQARVIELVVHQKQEKLTAGMTAPKYRKPMMPAQTQEHSKLPSRQIRHQKMVR